MSIALDDVQRSGSEVHEGVFSAPVLNKPRRVKKRGLYLAQNGMYVSPQQLSKQLREQKHPCDWSTPSQGFWESCLEMIIWHLCNLCEINYMCGLGTWARRELPDGVSKIGADNWRVLFVYAYERALNIIKVSKSKVRALYEQRFYGSHELSV